MSLEAFAPGVPFFKQILAFFNGPFGFLLILLFISWKYPKIGGILLIIASLALTIYSHLYEISVFLMSTFPVLLAGILFIVIKKERKS